MPASITTPRILVNDLNSQITSALEVTETYLNRIESINPKVGAYLQSDSNAVRNRVGELSATDSPMFGMPIAIKDNICNIGSGTTCASRMLENFRSP